MSYEKYFWMTVGTPASGKSTWIREEVNARNLYPNPIVLSSDGIIEELCQAEGLTYDEGFSKYIKRATAEFFQLLTVNLSLGKNVMVDRTNLTRTSRKKILDLVPEDYKKVAIVFYCDPDIQDERLLSRPGKTIPPHVIKSMRGSYEPPELDEGFDSITYVTTG